MMVNWWMPGENAPSMMTPWHWKYQWHMRTSGWGKTILANSGKWRQTFPPTMLQVPSLSQCCWLMLYSCKPSKSLPSLSCSFGIPGTWISCAQHLADWGMRGPPNSICSVQHGLAWPHFLSSKFVWPRLACCSLVVPMHSVQTRTTSHLSPSLKDQQSDMMTPPLSSG